MATPRMLDPIHVAWLALHGKPPPPELECGPASHAQADPEDTDEGRKRKKAAEHWRRAAGQRARRVAMAATV